MAIIKPNNNTISAITALPAGVGGKVLQVVQTLKTGFASTTSTSLSDISGLSVNITPSSTSNKVFVLVTVNALVRNIVSNSNTGLTLVLADGSNTTLCKFQHGAFYQQSNTVPLRFPADGVNFLHSPSSTSQQTYKVRFATTQSGNEVGVADNGDTNCSITAMEIAG